MSNIRYVTPEEQGDTWKRADEFVKSFYTQDSTLAEIFHVVHDIVEQKNLLESYIQYHVYQAGRSGTFNHEYMLSHIMFAVQVAMVLGHREAQSNYKLDVDLPSSIKEL